MKAHLSRHRHTLYTLLRKSEAYLKTDMVYLTRSGFWMTCNTLIASVFSFASSVLFAYFVPKDLYGTYKYLISAVGIFTALSLTGMNMAVVRAVAQGYEGVFVRSLSLQLLWSIPQLLSLVAIGIYYFAHGNTLFGWSFLISSILAPLASTANTYTAYLTGKKEFRAMALYGIYGTILNFIALATTIVMSHDVLILVLVFTVARALINIFLCARTIAAYRPNTRSRAEDVSYAKHMSVMNILGEVAANIENVIVFQLLGPVSVSLYSFALALPDRLKSLFGFIGTAALAKMAGHPDLKIGYALWRKTALLIVLGLVLALMYIPLAPFLFSLFFPNYVESVPYSQWYALAMITIAASLPVSALYAKKMQTQLYVLNIGSPLIKIGIFMVSTYLFGLTGAFVSKILFAGFQIVFPSLLLLSGLRKESVDT